MTDTFGFGVQAFLLSSVLHKRKIISSCSKMLFSSIFCYGRFRTKDRRLVSSIGRAPDCRAEVRGFKPQTGLTLRVLK